MKKFIKLACSAAVVGGLYAYMKENGVPVMGNVTMKLPYKSKYDIYDLVDKVLSYVKLP